VRSRVRVKGEGEGEGGRLEGAIVAPQPDLRAAVRAPRPCRRPQLRAVVRDAVKVEADLRLLGWGSGEGWGHG
jgi:hypothetical protein